MPYFSKFRAIWRKPPPKVLANLKFSECENAKTKDWHEGNCFENGTYHDDVFGMIFQEKQLKFHIKFFRFNKCMELHTNTTCDLKKI